MLGGSTPFRKSPGIRISYVDILILHYFPQLFKKYLSAYWGLSPDFAPNIK